MTVRVTLDLAKIDRMAEAAAEKGLKTALARGEAVLRADILSRPGSGRVYGKHRASAPGEPPAPDTGSLRNKTQADPTIRSDGEDLVGRIVANTEYAAALELGTERMAPRPYLSRLKAEHAPELARAFVVGAKSS